MVLKQKRFKYLLETVSKDKWQRIGLKKRTGILIPLFSVYSRNSIGIGDLEDLKLIIDWANKTGNSIIQLLPMNELGSLSCPYDSLSSFALEPVYISLSQLPQAKSSEIVIEIEKIKKSFPVGKTYVDYRIKNEKINLLWKIFSKDNPYNFLEFRKFVSQNSYWLEDFAIYKVLKDNQAGRPWYEWEDRFKNRDKYVLEDFRKVYEKQIVFQIWMQWQLYQQFREIKRYAQTKNVLIKGDLPILVSRDSADVWSHPEFFKLDFAAGAPPDMYCAKGQRWGMPTYKWEVIAKDNYRYLKEKIKFAENFYDILRIDHVVGLFRIWSIPYNEPLENQGLNGFFDPKDESKWGEQGKGILSVMLNSTKILLCAEDLGIIPKVCPKTIEELGIPGNDVQRWVKDWKVKHNFFLPKDYRKLSVTMLSTHDTTNWKAWWQYEAGTVDEALFIRKCKERGIDYTLVRDKLFDLGLSHHGRLRWLNRITSSNILISILDKPKEKIGDFIDLYKNTFQEKEKLWKLLGMKGTVTEEASQELVKRVLKMNLDSNAIFCIQTIIDWLSITDIFKGDPYQYRINTPGKISEKNWSLAIPISLDELLQHKVCAEIRKMIITSGRI